MTALIPAVVRSAQVVPEPVERWQNVDGKGANMLDAFYQNPERFAYTFQNYVFVTRVMQARPTPSAISAQRPCSGAGQPDHPPPHTLPGTGTVRSSLT